MTLGAETPPAAQILGGLRDGERVVLSPPESLRDGAAVKLADRPERAGRRFRPEAAAAGPLVEIRGVTKHYQRGSERIEVLHGIDLEHPAR